MTEAVFHKSGSSSQLGKIRLHLIKFSQNRHNFVMIIENVLQDRK